MASSFTSFSQAARSFLDARFTGHCDYKSMKPYIDITESAKRDAIAALVKVDTEG